MRGIRTKALTLTDGGEPDDKKTRILKHIPAEVVALYLTATAAVPADEPLRMKALWVLVLVGILATFGYMFVFARTPDTKKPIWTQIMVATIAFPVWAFAVGAPFTSLSWYRGWIASVLLVLVTFGLGLIPPHTKPNG